MPILPRLYLLEINDEDWFPPFLRARVQAALTFLWTLRLPILQRLSPADLVASTLTRVLGSRISEYSYIDFASGAGGPTAVIEKEVNRQLLAAAKAHNEQPSPFAQFLLSDLHPHPDSWTGLCAESANLNYIPTSVDAANASSTVLQTHSMSHGAKTGKHIRLFSLAFHHFPDPIALSILENTLLTSSGFAIFELQSRDIPTILLVTLIWPLLLIITPLAFLSDPVHLFFTYVIPIIPFVLCFDGYVSALRTRTPKEVRSLLERAAARVAARHSGQGVKKDGVLEDPVGGTLLLRHWTFMSGNAMHTPPLGKMNYVICLRDEDNTVAAVEGTEQGSPRKGSQGADLPDWQLLRKRLRNGYKVRQHNHQVSSSSTLSEGMSEDTRT